MHVGLEEPEKASQSDPSSACLMDLPEGLLTSILRYLPLQHKIQAQVVCKTFRDILCNPSHGSSVWGSIRLKDIVLKAASPTALAGWLMRRARGIQLLQYMPSYLDSSKEITTPEARRKQEIIWDVVPKVAAQLSPEAAIELDLKFATAEALSGGQEPLAALPMPHRAGPLTPYWASLAGSLTRLGLTFDQSVGGATILPLNQLTRLQSLSLRLHCWSADLELSFPQLRELDIVAVQHAITLMCPELRKFRLKNHAPLKSISGIPDEIEDLSLRSSLTSSLHDCSTFLHAAFLGRRLEQLKRLDVTMPPEAYKSSVASQIIKQVLREGKLTALVTTCPLEQLTPLTRPQCALPTSLQRLKLYLPLERGIPVVLEQLTNLRCLTLIDTKQGPMHLDRSLDPFLNMKDLGCLRFLGYPAASEHAQTRFEWTSEALGFLSLARIRLQREAQMPGSREPLKLCC